MCDEKINSVQKAESIEELLESCPKNQTIGDNLVRAWSNINSRKYKNIFIKDLTGKRCFEDGRFFRVAVRNREDNNRLLEALEQVI